MTLNPGGVFIVFCVWYRLLVVVTCWLCVQPAYRELISVLLSDMYGTLVNSKDMMKGTVSILHNYIHMYMYIKYAYCYLLC